MATTWDAACRPFHFAPGNLLRSHFSAFATHSLGERVRLITAALIERTQDSLPTVFGKRAKQKERSALDYLWQKRYAKRF